MIEKTKPSPTKTVAIRLDQEIAEHIQRLADNDDRSFSWQVARMLKDWLAEHDKAKPAKGAKS